MAGMKLPGLTHIGVVVRDVEEAARYYSDVFGLGPFRFAPLAPGTYWYRGKPAPVTLKMALAETGTHEFELIEYVAGDGPWKAFIDEKGEGIQHLAYTVDDAEYDAWLAHLSSKGIGLLWSAEARVEGLGHVRAAYLDSAAIGGIIIELIGVRSAAK